MTNQEAITKLTNIMHDDHYAWHPSILTTFGMAVDALKGAEGDCISRAEAIDAIKSMFASTPTQMDMKEDCLEIIENLPSVTLELPIKKKCTICPHCDNCDVNDDGTITQPEQGVKDCRTCKHGKYNDYHDTYFCYNAEDCSNWDKWETSAQPDITLESAIDYLHSIGWIQEHDRILTESAQTEHNSDDERKIADLHKMVNYLLSRLESQWIPVSEGLPKEYGEYICTMENGQVQECGFVPENQRGLVDGWSTCEADGYKFLGYVDVLAWMPLPEPYGGEQDG